MPYATGWKPVLLRCAILVATLNLVAAAEPETPPARSPVDGTWQWHFTMPDGTETRPKLRLKQEGAQLTGKSIVRSGVEAAITNGTIDGNALRFTVIRERNGATVVTRYSGQLDGDVIRGKVESNWSGETQSYDWEARRMASIDGTWKWSSLFGNRPFESRVKLKLDGDKLTGEVPGRDGRATKIQNGTLKDGSIAFEVDRSRDDNRFIQKFHGKLDGDKITGTIETTFGNGEPRTVDWDAERVD